MKKILVTGGTGFIGSHTVVALSESGYQPVLIDNFSNSSPLILRQLEKIIGKKPLFYQGNCEDSVLLDKIFKAEPEISAVIHFAASKSVSESLHKPLQYYQNNLNSLLSVLKTMQENKVYALVFSSSCTVYGQPDSLPVTESFPLKQSDSPYGKSKQMAEQIIKDLGEAIPAFKSCLLRYFNPIGAHPSAMIGENPSGIPENLIPYVTQTAAGLRESLTVYGDDYHTPDGTCIRDFIHVVDLAEAHVAALKWLESAQNEASTEVFNLGTGKGNSVREVINTFEKINRLKLSYNIGKRRVGDIVEIYADATKAEKVLKWKAKLTLADALKHAWQWQLNSNSIYSKNESYSQNGNDFPKNLPDEKIKT